MKTENNKALKEWATVVEALGTGKQTFMIRRKGKTIKEERGKFVLSNNEFFLYPTFGPYQTNDMFQDQFQDFFNEVISSQLESGKVEIKYYVQVDEVLEVDDSEKLEQLSNFYVWTLEHVKDYLEKAIEKKVYIIFLRVYRLPETETVEVSKAMSWVNLTSKISTEGCVPVLSQEEYQSLVSNIKERMIGPPSPVDQEKIRLRKEIESLKEQIKHLEQQLQLKEPISKVISILKRVDSLGFIYLEWGVYRAFKELGFTSVWNGVEKDGLPVSHAPRGYADVEIEAPLAGEPYYIIAEATKTEDAPTQVAEIVKTDIHQLRKLPERKEAKVYRLLVAPRFTQQAEAFCETVRLQAQVKLISSNDLIDLLMFHQQIGGITQEEFRRLLDSKNRGQFTPELIANWKTRIESEREQLALLLEVYDILYEEKEWLTNDQIQILLKKKRGPGISTKQVDDALKILETSIIEAVTERKDNQKIKYKAAIMPQTFRLRIRKLEEEILKNRGN